MYKTSLKVHIVLCCKYRKQLLSYLGEDTKQFFFDISKKWDFTIELQETDRDHIHLLISYNPKVAVSQIIRVLKSEATILLWRRHYDFLRRHFWKKQTFWSDGYFACSIGESSEETIRKYIESQG